MIRWIVYLRPVPGNYPRWLMIGGLLISEIWRGNIELSCIQGSGPAVTGVIWRCDAEGGSKGKLIREDREGNGNCIAFD